MNLNIFNTDNLFEAATKLFGQLNIQLNSNTAEPLPVKDILKQHYKDNDTFKAIEKTYFIGIIDDSVFKATGMFDGSYSYAQAIEQGSKNYHGLMLFALEMSKQPTRTEISELTRAFNRISLKMPVALLLKYQTGTEACFSLALSERFKYKQNWRDGEKAGKIIILRDIHTVNTHAGHQRILLDLKKDGLRDYDALHKHWLEVLDVNILNKKFFQDLANWYFWALPKVSFPDDLEKKDEVRNPTNLIRLITRVVFIWFIKEKSLVPNRLFDKKYLEKILKSFNPENPGSDKGVFYHAILQNLFFGTLNQKIEERKFAKEGDTNINKAEYGVKNLFRYADLFHIPENEAMQLFKDVPFLNGGLFDCLDKPNEDGKILYVDGFSRNPKKQAIVPDYVFFGGERDVNLNEVYDTKNKKYKTKGLINLLESYKFTVAENTPIEEEIALDPELLGKVFENLLASYNPETQTTARKQTGSFYTPREIVNYMVDESLLEYLATCLNHDLPDFLDGHDSKNQAGKQNQGNHANQENHGSDKLRDLLSYSENPNPFSEQETLALIQALNDCKILDPACGSGAYPMGVLHKMVHILQKLDPENKQWKALQRQKAVEETEKAFQNNDKDERAKRLTEINDVFENNSGDYGRKLYLIENCIYGIDIQPIAVQISKLRFFISLIIDQKANQGKENFGFRSLPNLETKFVAANTLIGLDKPAQTLLRNPKIEAKEAELKELRHKYFTANTRKEKLQYQKQDKELRKEIAQMLEKDGWQTAVAKQIVAFDPYDQNTFAPWFEPEWMFGLTTGFDIVIGNPPYGATLETEQITYFKNKYKIKTSETAILFIEKGLDVLKVKGFQSYIIPKAFTFASNYEKTRDFVVNDLKYLVDCGKAFENVKLEACVFGLKKKSNTEFYNSLKLNHDLVVEPSSVIDKSLKNKFGFLPNGLTENEINLGIKILDKSILLSAVSKNSRGEILQSKIATKGKFPIIGGKEINKYGIRGIKGFINDPKLISEKSKIHTNSILAQRIVSHLTQPYDHLKIIACIPDKNDYLIVDTINQLTITDPKISRQYVWGLLNSKLVNWYCYLFILAKAIRTIQFDNPVSSRIPIIKISSTNQLSINSVVDYILLRNKNNQDSSFYERLLDAMVYELYLPEEIKAGGAEVLKHLGNLPGLKEGEDGANLKTIEKVYKELSDPKHPIGAALLKLPAIEEVNIIEGRK